MDLYRNLLDNIKECELKLGGEEMEISFYYPTDTLLELLDCTKEDLPSAMEKFQTAVEEDLGKVVITQTKEKDRYQVIVPKKAFRFVKEHVPEPQFLAVFLQAVKIPGQTLAEMIPVFQAFGEVIVEKQEEKEWAVYFEDPGVDPYVYWLEEDEFGLEYHRFTRESYKKL